MTYTLFPYTTLFRSCWVHALYCLKPRSETAIDYPSRHSRPPQASLFRSTGHCEWPHPIAANGLIAGACLSYARTTKSTSIKVPNGRSEEHTSELQSLMRISYAVFCLKKKKRKN